MEDLISIIVPVYNAEKYLTRCTNSILHQTHKNIELILVNDGSKDNSLNLCLDIASQDPRVKVINKANGGAASARNKGLDIAIGDYIGFCDSDDYIHPDMYSDLLRIMKENNLSTIECTSRVEDKDGNEISRDADDGVLIPLSIEESLRAIFLRCGNVSLSVRLTKKEFIHEIRIPEGRRVEDFYFTILLLLRVKNNAIYRFPYYTCCTNAGSVTRSATGSIYIDALYFFEESLKVLKHLDELLYTAEQYYKYKMYYLFSISMTKEEERQYANSIYVFQKDIRNNIHFMLGSHYFKKKEKLLLLLGAVSMKSCRYLYTQKETLKKWLK